MSTPRYSAPAVARATIPPMPQHARFAIIGGGIVGLATAYRLVRDGFRDVVVLEKEARVAEHQTGHNSGVLHSGIYYRPGSMKAIACRAGKKLMEAFCADEGIPYEICGKVIVATDDSERTALASLYERGVANGVDCERVGPERLRELEPYARGVEAIHVREAGIVSYRSVCERLRMRIEELGGRVLTSTKVTGLIETTDEITIVTEGDPIAAKHVINCAGLHSDGVAAMSGADPGVRIIPFRGEYFRLGSDARRLCRTMIYPVPDPRFPFLGVHFTRRIDGSVECGPNAVLAFAREGYRKRDVVLRELLESITYPGFRTIVRKYWRTGAAEMWRSISKRAFVTALRRLVPEIRAEHLERAPAGVRAQAVTACGELLDDFRLIQRGRQLHVVNAPSPAATAALSIADTIARRAL